MIDHVYRGISFRVNENEPRNRWNDYCQALLDYRSEYSQRHSKPEISDYESAPVPDTEKPLEALPGALEDTLYDSGHYRQPCKVCGKGIKRTGTRGRALRSHADCRS